MGMLMAEVETQLRAGMRISSVDWLTSPQLAAAVRTGFAPGDRAGIIEALAARDSDPTVNADVPWAQAGPSGAETTSRHYRHDAWHSITATLRLPAKGAVLGALAPVLVPTEPGERRSMQVVFPILPATTADRQALNAETAADMGEALRSHAGVKTRAKDATAIARTRNLDAKLASGHALVRPYAGGVHHRARHHADRRVRPPPGRLHPTRRVRPATARPRPGRRAGWWRRRSRRPGRGRAVAGRTRRVGWRRPGGGFAAATIPLGVGLDRSSDQ